MLSNTLTYVFLGKIKEKKAVFPQIYPNYTRIYGKDSFYIFLKFWAGRANIPNSVAEESELILSNYCPFGLLLGKLYYIYSSLETGT